MSAGNERARGARTPGGRPEERTPGGRPEGEPRAPIRDRDLRHAVAEHGLRPGDPAWRALVELQRHRDADRRERLPQPSAPVVEREGEG